jgi:RNAse (barnase) inhibitor barstar
MKGFKDAFKYMKKQLLIRGDHIHNIASFYDEINRVFMQHEDWKIGQSLDALNDLLYGNYGEIKQSEAIQLVWHSIEKSRNVLGFTATRTYYKEKLASPPHFNTRLIQERLNALEDGNGPTFFEIVIAIIAEHPNIELIETEISTR